MRSMALTNFKSYGGTVQVGPFHRRFTAAVGPNGSGKSNLIDALLFVFGKRAKQMRLSRVSELIHRSEQYPDADAATVSVEFCEIDDDDAAGGDDAIGVEVPDSRFVVSRTACRNNTSTYKLNGNASTFTEVTQLFRSKGVDLENNRFLILQGEVEQIALMKPKAPTPHEDGLLEYLEDIVGTNRYVEPIDAAARDMERLNEERTVRLNRVKVVDREREALEEAKCEAEQYLVLEHELNAKRLQHAQCMEASATQQLGEARGGCAALEEQCQAELAGAAEAQARLQQIEAQHRAEKREHHEIETTMKQVLANFAEYEKRDVQLREDVKHTLQRKNKLQDVVKREEKRAAECERTADEQRKAQAQTERELGRLREQLRAAEQQVETVYASIRDRTSDVRAELERQQTALLPLRQQLDEARQQRDVALQECALLDAKAAAPGQALEEATAQRQSLHQQIAALETEVAEQAVPAQAAAQQRLADAERALEAARAAEREATARLARLRRTAEEARAGAAAEHGRSRVLHALTEAARRGKLHGLVGRLGDLGDTDAQYEVAMAAAAGAAFDQIVVEHVEDAQACIEYLRQHQIGRATFIVLNKLEHLHAAMNSTSYPAPEQAPRLFDLVRVADEAYRVAFYFVLRNTLLARDLEQATRLAYQPTRRNRVVTLAGQLIEASGAMSGGGNQTGNLPVGRLGRRGGNSSRGRAETADAENVTEAEMRTAQQRVDAAAQALAQAETERRAAAEALRDAHHTLERLRGELESRQRQARDLASRLPELQARAAEPHLEPAERRRHAELRERLLPQHERQIAEATAAAESLEAAVHQLQERIVAAGGPRLASAKAAAEEARARLAEESKALAKAEAAAEAATAAVDKARASAAAAHTELATLDEQHRALLEQIARLEGEAETVARAQAELREALDAKAKALTAMQSEMDAQRASMADVRRRELDLRHQIEDAKKQARELQAGVSQWQRQARQAEAAMRQAVETMPALFENDDAIAEREEETERGASRPSRRGPPASTAASAETLALEVAALEQSLQRLHPNLGALAEYAKKEREYAERVAELDALTEQRDRARREHERLRRRRLEEFMAGFGFIANKLKEMYQMITFGGDAELELVDSLDPFAEGVAFSVRPPKKSWKHISNLSGGEKTLASMSLVFALHQYKPTPLYIMDEIDAALDFRNVSIVAHYIRERARNAQFFIISLRNDMFELADRLLGVYKSRNTSHTVSIDPTRFVLHHFAPDKENVGQAGDPVQASKLSVENAAEGPRPPAAPVALCP